MTFTKLLTNVKAVSALPDKPSLSADALKAEFDKGAEIIKTFLNETLIPELEAQGGGGASTLCWLPAVDAGGNLSWTQSSSTTAPTPVNIKGQAGRGILNIELRSGTHAPGTVDVYWINYTDGTHFEFSIYNGADGAPGSGSGGGGTSTLCWLPAVDASGNLSWAQSSSTTAPTPVNIKGQDGQDGQAGEPGPNEISTNTSSSIVGILKGSGGKVEAAEAGTDYAAASHTHTGYAGLDENNKVTANQASARIVSVTANKTLALTDAGCLLQVGNGSSAIKITVPLASNVNFPVGTEIEIMRWATGDVTIEGATSGVTIYCVVTGTLKIKDRYTSAALKKMAANAWVLQGNVG